MFRLAILLFFFIPLFSQAQEWKNFTDTAGYFTTKYPADWVNKIKEGNRVFFTSPQDGESDTFRENINISVTKNPEYGTTIKIKDLVPAVREALEPEFKDYKEEITRYFKWNGADAVEVIYTGYNKRDESIWLRTTQWYCFYKTRLYVMTFVALANKSTHNANAKKIMNAVIFK